MTPKILFNYLLKAIARHYAILIIGKPGIGKTDIIKEAAAASGTDVIMSHPVVNDPTDYKGFPFATGDGRAEFLPFGDLDKLIRAQKDTVFFIDDLGQAPEAVQAACMQLILGRQINGHQVSDKVTFLAASNRQEDKAGVKKIIEPLKSRFTILKLEVLAADWIKWAVLNDMPAELIAYIRFKPNSLDNFQPSKDIVNSASPRTVANLGRQQRDGLDPEEEQEVFAGIAGEVFATEYLAFLDLYRKLPSLDDIIANPKGAFVDENPSVMYAVTGGLAKMMTDQNIGAICTYLDRVEPEFAVACMSDATTRNKLLCNNRAYHLWAKDHVADII